jgi:hypothetical protein
MLSKRRKLPKQPRQQKMNAARKRSTRLNRNGTKIRKRKQTRMSQLSKNRERKRKWSSSRFAPTKLNVKNCNRRPRMR